MPPFISRINENTSIPLKIAAAVAIATATISVQLWTLRSDIDRINSKIDGAWSVQNMELWTTKFQRDNPTLKIPSAKEGIALER